MEIEKTSDSETSATLNHIIVVYVCTMPVQIGIKLYTDLINMHNVAVTGGQFCAVLP